MRIGIANSENIAAACTRLPTVTAPLSIRHAPTSTNTTVPTDGKTSSTGSNNARSAARRYRS